MDNTPDIQARVINLCRILFGRNARLIVNNQAPSYDLIYREPVQRTPGAMAYANWVEQTAKVSHQTFDAAWRAQVLKIYESTATRTVFSCARAGRLLIRQQPTQIVNIKAISDGRPVWFDVYCGRPSAYGNPFKIKRDAPEHREAAVKQFAEWIDKPENDAFRDTIGNLKGLRLGCWCLNADVVTNETPRICHCVALSEVANGWKFDAGGYPIAVDGAAIRYKSAFQPDLSG